MYTKACDFMLDVVDGLEEGFTECTEGLVALSATILLRYLREVEVEKAEVESLAQVCLTVASKLTERMYVPLASSTREQRSAEEARRPELELQLLDRLDWKINIITPYGLRATALEAVYALLPLPAPPTDVQRVQCRCARPPRPSTADPPRPRKRRRAPQPPLFPFPSPSIPGSPVPPSSFRSKLLEVYLYLGVRDAAYLVLPDQAAALAAAAELAASKALGTPGDQLPALCAALGVTDAAAARLMRELMLRAVSGAPIEEVGECCKERDSPVTVFTDFY